MRGRRIGAAGVLALLMAFTSCAPKRSEVLLDTTAIRSDQLLSLVRDRSNLVRTLEGRGLVTYSSPDLGGSATFELSLKKPDSLLVFLEGPLGIDVGTLFMSRDRYVIYNPMENVAISGKPKRGFIRGLIPVDLTFEEILNAFSGSFDVPADASAVTEYRIDDGQFLVTLACGRRLCTYWIDHENLRVTKFEAQDTEGRLLMQATASSFATDDDASVPRRITLSFPEEEREVRVQYSALTINPGNPSFAYSVPDGARKIIR
jgi:outer membrane lipoprotein-sorting protein